MISAVQQKIQQDKTLAGQPIQVSVERGIVVLSGKAASEAQRMAAETDANHAGAQRVLNEITVPASMPTALAANSPAVASAAPRPSPKRKWGHWPAASRRRPPAVHRHKVTTRHAAVATASTARSNATPAHAAPPAAAAPPPAAPPQPVSITVPAGTAMVITLDQPLSSKTNANGDAFSGRLVAPVAVDGQQVIPTGAVVHGKVVLAHSAGHYRGRSELRLVLDQVRYNGLSYRLQTQNWDQRSQPRGVRTAQTVGGGGGLGALIGAIAGGGKGAAIGAAVGAGAGAAAQALTKPPEIELPAETRMQFLLSNPVAVQPAAALLRP